MESNGSNQQETKVVAEGAKKEEEFVYAPKGVGGLLLLLCISLILSSLKTLFLEIPLVDEVWGIMTKRFPGLQESILIHKLLLGGLAIWGLSAGYKLAKVQPGAVKLAKGYFVANILYPVAFPFIFYAVSGLPQEIDGRSVNFYFREMLPIGDFSATLAATLFWIVYLNRSKRVRNTYFTE